MKDIIERPFGALPHDDENCEYCKQEDIEYEKAEKKKKLKRERKDNKNAESKLFDGFRDPRNIT